MSNSIEYRVTGLLTEHLGVPPLTVVDEVINAVNHILYQCTQAMETYLVERQKARLDEIKHKAEDDDVVMEAAQDELWVSLPKDEISLGTAKLETLLESQVDKNFDKFELYSLRNIFTIPHDLVEGGWVRLKHQEGIDFSKLKVKDNKKYDADISTLIKDINCELKIRKILKIQITKANKIITLLQGYRTSLSFLGDQAENGTLSPEAKQALKNLSPIDDNLYFLLSEVDTLISQVNRLYQKFHTKVADGGIKDMSFKPNLRDYYLQSKSIKLLESIGIIESNDVVNGAPSVVVPNIEVSNQDVDNLRKLI